MGLTTAILSDLILTLQMVEILIFWEGILTVKPNDRVEILRDRHFLHQNSLGQPAPQGLTLTGALDSCSKTSSSAPHRPPGITPIIFISTAENGKNEKLTQKGLNDKH